MSPRQTMSLGDKLLQLLLSIRCTVRISLVPTLVLMVFYVSTFRRMCAMPYYYYYYYYYYHHHYLYLLYIGYSLVCPPDKPCP